MYTCNICAKLIAQSGIVEVVYKKDLGKKDRDVQNISEKCFNECFIDCRFIKNAAFFAIIIIIIMLSILENL